MKKIGIVFGVIVLVCMGMSFTFTNNTNNPRKPKTYDRTRLLEYITEEEKASYEFYEDSWSSNYPPLKPERLRRRMKMLFAIDIKEYPENAWIRIASDRHTLEDIYFKGEYLSLQNQKIYLLEKKIEETVQETEERSPFGGMEDSVGEDYGTILLDYLLYNDLEALDSMITYKYRLIEKSLGETWENDAMAEDLLFIFNIPYKAYSSIHTVKPELIQVVDQSKYLTDASRYLQTNYQIGDFYRASAIRGDLHFLYINAEKKKKRLIKCNTFETIDNISISKNRLTIGFFHDFYSRLPWKKNTPKQSITEYMSFLVQLQEKELNKFVIQYMSGQFETHGEKEVANTYRSEIRDNNYYGHAILREFCENPEREMPTLEKIGTSFAASVKNANTLLYLEPYPDSYDIDTIQPTESFKAYEMGYDDYYFIEISKPVESPVAGADGYAMILDRTETVYGYLRKDQIKEISAIEQATKQITTSGTRKVGVIDDPDGFVNIRKESNSSSETIGKLTDGEAFFYWEVPNSNWWLVQTKDETRGFVHKSRIREKIDAGNWFIEEK